MWQEENGSLQKSFLFPDFQTALNFVNEIGKLAEQAQHHPDIAVSWGKVTVSLSTHSEGKVTEKDRQLANEIDSL